MEKSLLKKLMLKYYDIDEFRTYSNESERTLYLCSDSDGIVVIDNSIKLIGNIFKI